ncbi:integrase catalytic domain-containing protein [Trichonephila clavipes]|nr:integrase catalytic domain-containing protein [Trichonephila clavipes]
MALKLNLKKDELISVAVEMGRKVNKRLKNELEAEKNKRETEKNKRKAEKNEREAEIKLEKVKLSQIEKQLELEKLRKESEKNPQTLQSGEPSSITDKLESLRKIVFALDLRPFNSLIPFSRDKTRNPPPCNLNLDAPTFVPGQIEGSVEANSQAQFVATGFENSRLKNVFLSTVRALFKNKYSQWVEVRCLLDVGSQSCLCTRACAEKLQLKMEKINTVVSCVNDASMVVKNCVKTSVANKDKTFESELMLLVVNEITDLIPNKVIDVDVNVSEFVPLVDDKFNIPDRIDVLLGAEIFYELLKPGKFYCDNSHLVLQNTVFGYVKLAKDEKSRFLLASETLLYDTYMDDIVSGAQDLETAQQLQSQLKDAMQSCGINLHKWSSNSPELINSLLSSDVEHSFSIDIDLSV